MAAPAVTIRRALLAVAALCALARSASAQIHNVQSILATEPEEGLSGSLSGSADWRTGNISFLFLSATPVARYRAGDHLIVGIVRGERKSSAGTLLVSRTFEHLRYRYSITERLLVEGFGQHEYDGIKRLTIRALGGAGAKVDIVHGKNYGVGVGLAYMFEYELLSEAEMVTDSGEDDFAHRASSYLVGHYELDERVGLVETFYVQPRLNDPSDIRLLSDSGLTIAVTTKLSLTTAFSVAWDSEPPETVNKLDTALTTTVTYSF